MYFQTHSNVTYNSILHVYATKEIYNYNALLLFPLSARNLSMLPLSGLLLHLPIHECADRPVVLQNTVTSYTSSYFITSEDRLGNTGVFFYQILQRFPVIHNYRSRRTPALSTLILSSSHLFFSICALQDGLCMTK